MLFIHVVYKRLEISLDEKKIQDIIYIPSVYNRFKMRWKIVEPFFFLMACEAITLYGA